MAREKRRKGVGPRHHPQGGMTWDLWASVSIQGFPCHYRQLLSVPRCHSPAPTLHPRFALEKPQELSSVDLSLHPHASITPASCRAVDGTQGSQHVGSAVGFSNLGPRAWLSVPILWFTLIM